MRGIYLSPEQLAALKSGTSKDKISYNKFKSDVFTAGMLLAHICLWKNLQDTYYKKSEFEMQSEVQSPIVYALQSS
jgi:hypothetical protein